MLLVPVILKAGILESYDFSGDLRFNTLSCVVQDKSGFLWIGYDNGLARFDGHAIESYDLQINTLSLKDVNCLRFKTENILLIGTNRGLFEYDVRYNKLSVYDHDLLRNDITDIVCTDDGMVVIASGHGVYVYKNNNLWRHLDESSGLANNNVYSVCLDRDKDLWIGTDAGLSIVSLKNETAPCREFSDKDRYSKVFVDQNDNIWLCCNENVLVGNRQTVEVNRALVKVADNSEGVTALCRRGEVWIGTRGSGLLRFSTRRDALPKFEERIYIDPVNRSGLGNTVVSLCEDSFSNLWILTFDGIRQFSNGQNPAFISLKHDPNNTNTPSHNIISSLWCSPRGEVWMGTAEGLDRMSWDSEKNTWRINRFKDESGSDDILGANKIQTVEGLNDGSLLISTKRDIKFFNPATSRFFSNQAVNDTLWAYGMKNVLASSKDSKGNLYLGFAVGGLAVLSPDGQTLRRIALEGIGDTRHRSLAVDAEDRLWISSDNGEVYRALLSDDGQTTDKKIYESRQFNEQPITTIYSDKDGGIWVGTMNGLYKYDAENDSFIELEHPYPRETFYVSGIIEDNDSNIWITSLRGIYRITRDKDVQYYEPLRKSDIGKTAYKSGLAIDRNGLIMIGGVSGLIWFNPQDVIPDVYVPSVHLTGLSVLDKRVLADQIHLAEDIDVASEVKLNHKDYQFTISFSSLYLTDPSKIRYAYKLDGVDDSWMFPDPGRRYATYSNLRPGEYAFHVKSTNASGIWQDNIKTIKIRMRPAPWNTIGAWIFYALMILLVVFMVLRYFSLVQRIRYEKNLSQWKIQYYVNLSHGFRGPLTLLQAPMKRLTDDFYSLPDEEKMQLLRTMDTNVSRLNFRLSQLMAFRKVDTGKEELHLSTEDIVSFVKIIFSNFKELAVVKGIDYRFESNLSDVSVVLDREKIELTLFNLLSNAFKYTERGGSVIVSCELDTAQYKVWISVKDTGPGIPKADLDKIFQRFWKGVGLSLAYEYVNMHHGQLTVDSEIGKGSTFRFSLLLGKSHFSKKEQTNIDNEPVKDRSLSESFVSLTTDFKSLMTPSNPSLPSISIIGGGEELSAFLLNAFSGRYNALRYEYSKEICSVLSKRIPDIVIADVEDDDSGVLEMCAGMRKDPVLSTIPIIILSPFETEEKIVQGFDVGADAYIVKPFTVALLISRIEQLLNSRERIKGHIRQELIVNPKEVDITSDNDVFLANVMKLLEEHMSDEEFSMDALAGELNISRSMLYRRLSLLTGQSPVKFVRTVRLKRAAQLLAATSHNVTEISTMVGFSDQRYFSTCFRQQFGMTPKEWAQAHRKSPKDNK